ncbi:MAG: SAF domain-containing protein [Actinobacteria bacterium]|nr:SAF domain-containing protein [Actinomycetota bacterium]
MALGIALVAVGALTAAWLVSVQGQHTAVLVLARDVPYGSVITDSDLTTAEVSVDPSVATIPAGDRESVVGSVAATTLTSGALLARNQLTVAAPPADGQVLVGLALAATRMPAGGLEPGDRILVVDTPNPDADPSAIPPSTIAATVVRLGSMDVNGVTVVDVTVASGDGPALAARSATGRVAVVLQPRAG